MRNLITYYLLSLLFNYINIVELNAQCKFHKLYRYSNEFKSDFGTSVIQTMDSGFIAIGQTLCIPITEEGIFIVKTNVCGDTLWQKAYDFSPAGIDLGNSIIQLQDSTYIICGTKYDSTESATDAFLLKLDINGEVIFHKPIEGGFNDRGVMHKQTEDKGFIIGGFNFDTAITSSKVFLLKTDSQGNMEWQQEYGGPYFSYLKSIDFTKDGGFIIGGDFKNSVTASWDLYLIKTDGLGNFQWRQYYGDSLDERKGFAMATMDGGYAIVGYKEKPDGDIDAYIVKTDSMGNIEWEKLYGISTENDLFKIIRQLPDSSYMLAGGARNPIYPGDRPWVWLIKLDTQGDSIWSRKYTYYGGDTDTYVEDMNLTEDGGFILTGYIINNAMPTKNDLWLLKTDSLGNVCEIDTTTYEGCSEFICSYLEVGFYTNGDTFLLTDSIYFYDTSQYANQWSWNFGDGETDTVQNPVHIYDSAGTYTVTLVITNENCIDSTCVTITVIDDSGVEELQITNFKFLIYPNPFKNETHIKYNIPETVYNAKIHIYNLTGTKLKTYLLFNGNGEILLRAKELGNGIYICKFIVPGFKTINKKLVVIK